MGLLLLLGQFLLTRLIPFFGFFTNILTKLPVIPVLIMCAVAGAFILGYTKGSANREIGQIKADRAGIERYVKKDREIEHLSDSELDKRLLPYVRDK